MRHNKLWTRMFITAVFGASAHTAYASYTVIDDDLFPTSRSAPSEFQPRSLELQRSEKNRTTRTEEQYSIPFTKLYHSLSTAGREKLDQLIPDMRGAHIHVVGRPDATYQPAGKFAPLARQRANMMRTYLMRHGIPAANITTEVDTSPNPQPNGATYPSDVYISYQEPYSADSAGFATTTLQPKYQTLPQKVSAPATSSASPNIDYRMIRYINQAVQTGNMSAAVALKLIAGLLDSSPTNSSTQSPVYSRVATRERQPTTRVNVEPITAQPWWALDKKLTLQENIDAWSTLAGWNPSQWDASNPYQVTVTTSLDGNFPDVLRQVADATGLNICAKKREKYVRVTDSNVSCK